MVDATLDTLRLDFDEHGPVCLLIVPGAAPGRAVELEGQGPWTLGRSRSADVRVDDGSVSRLHARVALQPSPTVEDLGSANGTRVRGATLEPHTPTAVSAGEPFELGAVLVMIARRGLLPADALGAPAALDEVIGDDLVCSPSMRALYETIGRVARSELSVLILGETGAGKEVVARALHRASSRADEPFVAINCGAITASLAESELFGHVRGAFTGADRDRAGLFERADGGTVFLDEIGELSPAAQAKLLRVLETREVVRVGSTEPRSVDVRVVSATHRDLPTEALSGDDGFRADLFFRLNGMTLTVPPLRERPDDIDALAARFAEGAPIAESARAALRAHAWPGNVRELRNVISRAKVMAAGSSITPEHLDLARPRAAPAPDAPSLDQELREVERERILEALEACAWNQTRAAKRLGMPRRTFVSRLDEYGIPRPRKRQKKRD